MNMLTAGCRGGPTSCFQLICLALMRDLRCPAEKVTHCPRKSAVLSQVSSPQAASCRRTGTAKGSYAAKTTCASCGIVGRRRESPSLNPTNASILGWKTFGVKLAQLSQWLPHACMKLARQVPRTPEEFHDLHRQVAFCREVRLHAPELKFSRGYLRAWHCMCWNVLNVCHACQKRHA